jgi:DNA polymerase III subunit delta'
VNGSAGTFDVVGATRALAYFSGLEQSTLAHGYLFSGPAGVGKKTFARRLAQSLLCEHQKRGVLGYDGTCNACVAFRAGSHPDYYESSGRVLIGDEREGAIEDDKAHSRGLVRELSLRPYSGRWRIAVLADVAFVSDWAAHAMLKFLEEPPPDVLIMLTTDQPHALFATIRSRLIELPFAPLPAAAVARILEGEGVAADEAHSAAASAMGSVTRARAVLESAETGLRDAAMRWLEDVLAGRTPDQSFLDRGEKAADRREIGAEMVETVSMLVRDWAAYTLAGPDARLLAGDMRERIAQLPPRAPAAIVAALAAAGDARRLAITNVSAALVVDALRMNLSPA